MCRSAAQGGRRCKGSSSAVRRAGYALRSSAAARTVRQALEDGDIDAGSPAYRAHQRAQAAAERARAAAREGDHDEAERAALDAKNAMNHASRLVRQDRVTAAETRKTVRGSEQALAEVNPKYVAGEHAYSNNCSHVVQAYELRRRGLDVKAGPIPRDLGGRTLRELEGAWDGEFVLSDSYAQDGGLEETRRAFSEPGSRGIVSVGWRSGGAHVFNVENVDGTVRFVDGQPNPPVHEADHYFARSRFSAYMRVDDRPTPSKETLALYLEK